MSEGLFGKYKIEKADGSPVDPTADYFVLRLDTDPIARIAANEYSVQTPDEKLGLELGDRVIKHMLSDITTDCEIKQKREEGWPLTWIKQFKQEIAAKDARIKELEIIEGVLSHDNAFKAGYIRRLAAAFLEDYLYIIEHRQCHYPGFGVTKEMREEARAALEEIKNGKT